MEVFKQFLGIYKNYAKVRLFIEKYCDKMRNLRLYKTDAAFKAHEQAAGGDGDSTVSIVPGVSMSKDIRKRYFNPNDGSVAVYTLAAKYTKEGTEFTPEAAPSQIKVKYITGTTSQVNVNAPSVGGGLKPIEPFVTTTVPTDTAVTFDYIYDKKELLGKYLTFEIVSGGTIRWKCSSNFSAYTKTIQYRKNGGTWTSITSDWYSSAPSITVVAGDIVEFKGDNNSYCSGIHSNCFSSSTRELRFNAYGNIMSLINSTDFKNLKTLASASAFTELFSGCTSLVKADNLSLPATTLAPGCYSNMFMSCTNLTQTPELPATTLAQSCYSGMFRGCTSLTQAPELPATTLAENCYISMFTACGSLTTAPALPAMTLAQGCYWSMFSDCKRLTQMPVLPARTLAENCYRGMFVDCTRLTQAPELPATTLANNCYYEMFTGCTSLASAPELPATTLAQSCYSYMFVGCTSLTQAPELPATTLADGCYSNMFMGCTSLTQAPELPATTLVKGCYWYMFTGCTSLTTAPELPATTLVSHCYNYMFSGCTSLNYIKCLATDISVGDCLFGWVSGVASSGTFIKAASMSSWTTGVKGIPTNWTVQDATV